jgi:hypothetical protein
MELCSHHRVVNLSHGNVLKNSLFKWSSFFTCETAYIYV